MKMQYGFIGVKKTGRRVRLWDRNRIRFRVRVRMRVRVEVRVRVGIKVRVRVRIVARVGVRFRVVDLGLDSDRDIDWGRSLGLGA